MLGLFRRKIKLKREGNHFGTKSKWVKTHRISLALA
jgi:hypothetical protein